MSANHAEKIIATIRATFTPPTYIPASTEIRDGIAISGPWHYVRNVTVDTLISLLSGLHSSEDTWEIQITMKRKDLPGSAESSPRQSEKKSPSTTEKSYEELSGYVKRVRPESSS